MFVIKNSFLRFSSVSLLALCCFYIGLSGCMPKKNNTPSSQECDALVDTKSCTDNNKCKWYQYKSDPSKGICDAEKITLTQCAEISDKACDAKDYIAAKVCGLLTKEVGSSDKACFELQASCTAIADKEDLCKAVSITVAGNSCFWNSAAKTCEKPIIEHCSDTKDMTECVTAGLVNATNEPHGCYDKAGTCTSKVANCAALALSDWALAADAIASGANKDCYFTAAGPLADKAADCASLPAADVIVPPAESLTAAGIALAPEGCYASTATGTVVPKVANCAALPFPDLNDAYSLLAAGAALAPHGCYLDHTGIITPVHANCAAVPVADVGRAGSVDRSAEPYGCYLDHTGVAPLIAVAANCAGVPILDVNLPLAVDYLGARNGCYADHTGLVVKDKVADCARLPVADLGLSAAAIYGPQAGIGCYNSIASGALAVKVANCAALNLIQADCTPAVNAVQAGNPDAANGCVWGVGDGQPDKCHARIPTNSCASLNGDKERCEVPGIRANTANCRWNVGFGWGAPTCDNI